MLIDLSQNIAPSNGDFSIEVKKTQPPQSAHPSSDHAGLRQEYAETITRAVQTYHADHILPAKAVSGLESEDLSDRYYARQAADFILKFGI